MDDVRQQTDQRSTPDEILLYVKDSLRGLKYGSINITVQDGVVVQIDRTEKQRFRQSR